MDRFGVPNVGVAPTFGAGVPNMPTADEGLAAGVGVPNTAAGCLCGELVNNDDELVVFWFGRPNTGAGCALFPNVGGLLAPNAGVVDPNVNVAAGFCGVVTVLETNRLVLLLLLVDHTFSFCTAGEVPNIPPLPACNPLPPDNRLLGTSLAPSGFVVILLPEGIILPPNGLLIDNPLPLPRGLAGGSPLPPPIVVCVKPLLVPAPISRVNLFSLDALNAGLNGEGVSVLLLFPNDTKKGFSC